MTITDTRTTDKVVFWMRRCIMNFIGNVLLGTRNFFCNLSDRYHAFQDAKTTLQKNFSELFDSTSYSIRDSIFSGRTACLDAGVYAKLHNVEKSFTTLEDLLSGKTKESEKRVLKPSFHRASRFKSLYISALAGIGTTARVYDALRNEDNHPYTYNVEDINNVITMKNKYFWKNEEQLKDIISDQYGLKVDSIDDFVKETMRLKVADSNYRDTARINYDSRIASMEMKDELVNSYIRSDKTLKDISLEFEKKYGMHVSVSTISRHARKYLSSKGQNFTNRRETRTYYSKS